MMRSSTQAHRDGCEHDPDGVLSVMHTDTVRWCHVEYLWCIRCGTQVAFGPAHIDHKDMATAVEMVAAQISGNGDKLTWLHALGYAAYVSDTDAQHWELTPTFNVGWLVAAIDMHEAP